MILCSMNGPLSLYYFFLLLFLGQEYFGSLFQQEDITALRAGHFLVWLHDFFESLLSIPGKIRSKKGDRITPKE